MAVNGVPADLEKFCGDVSMMNKFKPFLIGSLAGCALMFVSLQFHLIRSEDGFRMVPRTPQPSLGLFWVDIQGWTAEEFADRPELVRALAAHGSTDLVASSVVDSLRDEVSDGASAFDQLRESMDDGFSESGLQIPEAIPGSKAEDPNPFLGLPSTLFDRDAKKQPIDRLAATDDFKASPGTVAKREFPSIDSLFGTEGQDRRDSDSPQTSRLLSPFQSSAKPKFSEPSSGDRAPFTATEESDLITEMLFGDDDVTSAGEPDVQDGWRDTVAESRDRIMGDVRNEVADRAGEMAEDFRGRFQRTQQQAFDQTLESVEDYSARKLKESLPGSVNQFLNSTPSQPPATENNLPPELKALQNGFDPFLK